MKRLTRFFLPTLLALLGIPGLTQAQVMYIHQGHTAVAVPMAEAGVMNFAEGATLTVMGHTYTLDAIDSVRIVPTDAYTPDAIAIRYAADGAHVVMAASLVDDVALTIDGAHVTAIATPTLQREVTYSLSGTSADGSFAMDGEYKATVVLDGLTLTSTRGAAIDIANGKRIAVSLPDGTATTLTDAAGGTHKACCFINGHAEFSGGGSLTLTGRTKHAYASDEYTLLKADFSGSITVLAAEGDGMHTEQYFRMKNGRVTISGVKGDGIDAPVTNDATDVDNGCLFVEGGSISLQVTADDVKGLKCDNAMTLTGGTIEATVSGLGTKGISTGTDLLVGTGGNGPTLRMAVTGTTYMPGNAELESKCRGIKVKGQFTFDGGNISISATGAKSKAISVDGNYNYKSGSINCAVDAANT